jgi:hypothetical protein
MKVTKQAKWLTIVFVLLISACSSTQLAYKQNIALYFSSKQAVTLSSEQIKSSPADLIYVKNGERATATMALAFIEDGQYKWLSRDGAMLISLRGRIIRSIGFKQNLLHMSNLPSDPLALYSEPETTSFASSKSENTQWSRLIDTDLAANSDYGASLVSSFGAPINTSIVIQDEAFSVYRVDENVRYSSALYGEHEWTNSFWFDAKTNQLLQSAQTIAPNIDPLEIIYVSRAVRLLNQNQTGAEQ